MRVSKRAVEEMSSFDEKRSFGVLFSVVHRLSAVYLNEKLASLKISSGQHALLLYISDHEGCTQDDLVNAFSYDKATVARAVARLEANGYVSRLTDAEDRRMNRIYTSDKGRSAVPVICEGLSHWENELVKELSGDEVAILRRLLCRVSESALAIVKQQS